MVRPEEGQTSDRTGSEVTGVEASKVIEKAAHEAMISALRATLLRAAESLPEPQSSSASERVAEWIRRRLKGAPGEGSLPPKIWREFALLEKDISHLKKDVAVEIPVSRTVVSVWLYAAGVFAVAATALVWVSGVISILVPIFVTCVAAGIIGTVLAFSKSPRGAPLLRGTDVPVEVFFAVMG